MVLDLPADLESKVMRFAEEAGLSGDEAFQTLVEAGLRRLLPAQGQSVTNPERIIGAFADSPDFAANVAEVIGDRETRYTKAR